MVNKGIISHLIRSLFFLKKNRYLTGLSFIFFIIIFNIIAPVFIFRQEIKLIAYLGSCMIVIGSVFTSPFLSNNSRFKTYIGDKSFSFNYLYSLPITIYEFLIVNLVETLVDVFILSIVLHLSLLQEIHLQEIYFYSFITLNFLRVLIFSNIITTFKSRFSQWRRFEKTTFLKKAGDYYLYASLILFFLWIVTDPKLAEIYNNFSFKIDKFTSATLIYLILTIFLVISNIRDFNQDRKPRPDFNKKILLGLSTILLVFSSYLLGLTKYLKTEKNGLIVSVLNSDLSKTKLLIERHPELINQLSTEGNSPLYYAIYNHETEIAKALINAKADIQFKRDDNLNLLQLAALKCNYEIAYLLMEKGININEVSNYKRNALFYSARSSCDALSFYLINKGIATDLRDTKNNDYKEYGAIENKYFKERLPILIKMGLLK